MDTIWIAFELRVTGIKNCLKDNLKKGNTRSFSGWKGCYWWPDLRICNEPSQYLTINYFRKSHKWLAWKYRMQHIIHADDMKLPGKVNCEKDTKSLQRNMERLCQLEWSCKRGNNRKMWHWPLCQGEQKRWILLNHKKLVKVSVQTNPGALVQRKQRINKKGQRTVKNQSGTVTFFMGWSSKLRKSCWQHVWSTDSCGKIFCQWSRCTVVTES